MERANADRCEIYFDGACPLCRAEVSLYRRLDADGALGFTDVSGAAPALPPGLDRAGALARFHVRTGDGRLVSGAAAFVEVWRRTPGFGWAARLAALPGAPILLEGAYRLFLIVRPAISGVLRRLEHLPFRRNRLNGKTMIVDA